MNLSNLIECKDLNSMSVVETNTNAGTEIETQGTHRVGRLSELRALCILCSRAVD